ncbi:putrescine ABC transporter permease PotH, partial [Burkholderia contaminans]|nr:putrescine ABC transporter permease PotH [Burkholderia contaminans]
MRTSASNPSAPVPTGARPGRFDFLSRFLPSGRSVAIGVPF